MRDIKRIDPILEEMSKLWKANPDLRFGQLIYIISEKLVCPNGDIFFPEDDRWLKALKKINEERGLNLWERY